MRKGNDLTTVIVPKVEKIRSFNLPDPQGPAQACSGKTLLLPAHTHTHTHTHTRTRMAFIMEFMQACKTHMECLPFHQAEKLATVRENNGYYRALI